MADLKDLEKKLWAAADKLRSNMDAAEYKHVVLGLIFLKYISDAFEEKHTAVEKEGADPEDRDEYLAENIFWVPKNARWSTIRDSAKQPDVGTIIDKAMDSVERDNPTLKGVLPKNYAREGLDKRRLGQLIDLIGTITMNGNGHKSSDTLGRIYEYFIGMFADAEGKKGGQFYTPKSIVRLLVAMLEPEKGRVYDPCCGSGGMFVQSEKFVEDHEGHLGDIAIYGQESNQTTWRLCKMNLAIRGIEADIAFGDTLHNDQHKDLKADYVIANPPFNDSDWDGELLQDDVRWKYGAPPKGNANFAWVQHFVHHLKPSGTAGFVLANGSMSSQSGGEGEIRKSLIESDLVDCIVALPTQLFFNTGIPACLWFLARDRKNRSGKTLFVDAREMGHMVSRRHREFTDADIAKIADTYRRFKERIKSYKNQPGFCAVATTKQIAEHDYVLTPGRYVGVAESEEDEEVFEEKMQHLTKELKSQFAKSKKLEKEIAENLKKAGYPLK